MARESRTRKTTIVAVALTAIGWLCGQRGATGEEGSTEATTKPMYRLGDGKLFADMGTKRTWREDIPRRSEVCFSSRFKHPVTKDDPYDTLRSITEFHGTGLYWGYVTDPAWIAKLRDAGYAWQGALNPYVTDTIGGLTYEKGRMVNQAGKKLTVPWLVEQKMFFGCVNNPEFVDIFFEHAKFFIDNGARSLMVDDPEMNLSGARNGGCFCSFCIEKAKASKVKPNDEAFQRRCTIEFYKAILSVWIAMPSVMFRSLATISTDDSTR